MSTLPRPAVSGSIPASAPMPSLPSSNSLPAPGAIGVPMAAAVPDSQCAHLAGSLDSLLPRYKSAVSWAARAKSRPGGGAGEPPAKRRKMQHPSCAKCGLACPLPWVCLQCGASACWTSAGPHILAHLRESGHAFAVEARTGSLWCAKCDTIVLSKSLQAEHSLLVLKEEEKRTRFHVDARKTRETYIPWTPEPKDSEVLRGISNVPCRGRRGLLNLGNTCYLNCVLQAFLNNPLLRNYFLADRHNSKACERAVCVSCELDKLFAEVYSSAQAVAPYGPTSMLHATWTLSKDVSGYAQHDAHECLITLLNALHAHTRGSTSTSCNCVVHTVFAGQLQSEVRCARCAFQSRTLDPMLDVSLSLARDGTPAGQPLTLEGCLRRYTRVEKLDARSCPECGNVAEATKRMSIRRLPPVLCVQLKRFEHKSADKSAPQKIDAHVRFPASLNMLPYVTPKTGAKGGLGGGAVDTGPPSMYDYDLFAVVCHEGQIDNGHYTCFARAQDEWYRYDDDKVTHATLRDALSVHGHAYMLCYVKRRLEYRPIDLRPSYVRAREAEIEEEKKREREREQRNQRELEQQLLDLV